VCDRYTGSNVNHRSRGLSNCRCVLPYFKFLHACNAPYPTNWLATLSYDELCSLCANITTCISSTEIHCTAILSYRDCQSSDVQEVIIQQNCEFSRDVKVCCIYIDVIYTPSCMVLLTTASRLVAYFNP